MELHFSTFNEPVPSRSGKFFKSEEQTDFCCKTSHLFMKQAVFVFAIEIIYSWGT